MREQRWQPIAPTVTLVLGMLLLMLGFLLLQMTKLWRSQVLDVATFLTTAAGAVAGADGLSRLWSRWWRSTRSSPARTAADIHKAKNILADQVAEQWEGERRELLCGDVMPIPVHWRSTEHEVLRNHPNLIARERLIFSSRGDDITKLADDFRALRCRRLVILGEQGTGKTTLAVQLLTELVRTRRRGDPVPVLLTAARWNTGEHKRLQDWLAACLGMDYPALRDKGFTTDIPRALATCGAVLPVLDGLDEVPNEADILEALSQSMRVSDQLILTCRTAPFVESVKATGSVLTAAAIIEPDPLTHSEAASYLKECLPSRPESPWPNILEDLRSGAAPALAEVASNPLGLWLIREIYIGSNNDSALRNDPTRLRELRDLGSSLNPSPLWTHLYDQLIPALISSRPPTDDPAQLFRPLNPWEAGPMRDWLTYLARKLVGEKDSNDMAWWHLARYASTGLIRWAVSLICGLGVGLAIGALEGPIPGVGIGVLTGLIIWLIIRSWFTESPGYANFHIRGRASYLIDSLKNGLMAGLVGALVGWVSGGGPEGALALGLLSGLGYEFAVGVIRWVEEPTTNSTAKTPHSSWQADRNLTLIRTFSGLAIGLLAGFIGWKAKLGFPTVLTGGLIIGILFGLGTGRHHAWLAYNLTMPRLATEGRLPLRTMGFLEDAHRMGILRTEGPFYQFRNIELKEHFSRRIPVAMQRRARIRAHMPTAAERADWGLAEGEPVLVVTYPDGRVEVLARSEIEVSPPSSGEG